MAGVFAVLSWAGRRSSAHGFGCTRSRAMRARAFYEARGFVAIAFPDGAGNEEQELDVLYHWTSGA